MQADERTVALTNALSLTDLFAEIDAASKTTIPDAIEALDGDAEGLSLLLVRAKQALWNLTDAVNDLDHAAAKAVAPIAPLEIDGVGMIDVQYSNRDVWDHDAVWAQVTLSIRDDPVTTWDGDTGEQLPPDVIIENAIRTVRSVLTPSWKANRKEATGLYGLGIDANDYRTRESTGAKLRLPTKDTLRKIDLDNV